MCGESRWYDEENARNGRTPGAPDPSRFRSSPVGTRTSKPSASPRRDSRSTPAFTRTMRSPSPVAEPPASKVRSDPSPSGASGSR